MPLNICVLRDLKQFLSLNIWDYHFLGLKTAESTKAVWRTIKRIWREVRQARTCAAADRTDHALLHTLYQANLKAGTKFLNEWFAVDLIENSEGAIGGISCFDMETGEISIVRSGAVVLATGGAGQVYEQNTTSLICWRWIRYGSKKWITSARYGNVAVSPYRVVW